MNVYSGLTGGVERRPEPDMTAAAFSDRRPEPQSFPSAGKQKEPSSQTGILKGLGGLFSRIMDSKPQTEDLLLIGVMYLLYRESGDIEFLLIAGAMLFM